MYFETKSLYRNRSPENCRGILFSYFCLKGRRRRRQFHRSPNHLYFQAKFHFLNKTEEVNHFKEQETFPTSELDGIKEESCICISYWSHFLGNSIEILVRTKSRVRNLLLPAIQIHDHVAVEPGCILNFEELTCTTR